MPKMSITLVKSPIGYRPEARATVRALGLRRLHQTVFIEENPATRGMVESIPFLVRVEEATETRSTAAAGSRASFKKKTAGGDTSAQSARSTNTVEKESSASMRPKATAAEADVEEGEAVSVPAKAAARSKKTNAAVHRADAEDGADVVGEESESHEA
jgi:large subunit ribosomal protein L30